jgi:hypothetical protein
MNPGDRWLRAYISESDLGRIRWGQAATVHTDTYPDKRYKGEIYWVADEAEFTPRNVQTTEERVKLVYAAKVRVLADSALELKPYLATRLTRTCLRPGVNAVTPGLAPSRGAASGAELLLIEAGALFRIVGPDGAGKTTTLRMLAGVLRPARCAGGRGSVVKDPEGQAPCHMHNASVSLISRSRRHRILRGSLGSRKLHSRPTRTTSVLPSVSSRPASQPAVRA